MEWWNDLWLNEGFAKFMEFISLDLTYPELHVVRDFPRILLLYNSFFLNVERSLTGLDCRKPTYLTGHIKHLQVALFLF